MRKHSACLIAFLVCLFLTAAHASAEKRELTIMVYMCGSNLESRYGSASADMQEMITSEFSGRKVSLLVLTGGTNQWIAGYNPEDMNIIEIKNGKQRIVKQFPAHNMGKPETLTSFLQFGMKNYAADDYALILWDHGGGPLEGLCWDELFSLDHLSLQELTEALASAKMERKLKWIGFDACLMCSMEVAVTLSPYAEYMIASQETEPASGWNYAFLKDIDQDETGAETGKRIIDAYFDGQQDPEDILTLSCLDLTKAEKTSDSLNQFFYPFSTAVSSKNFAMLSDIRHQTIGFGNGIRATGDEGYDLVDATDLINRFDDSSGKRMELLQSLDQMIVCSRSNKSGANGISLYHPYSNAEKYSDEWHENYRDLHFCPGYTNYIENFGAILTGKQLTDWTGMETDYKGVNQDGSCQLELSLTRDQFEGISSAQLLVLASGFKQFGKIDDTILVYSGPAVIREDGILSASYDWTTLWVVDEQTNFTGPISFDLTDDGKYQVTNVLYTPKGYYSWETTDQEWVRFYLAPEKGDDNPVIYRTTVFDEATQTFSNRMAFDEKYYDEADFRFFFSLMPDIKEQGPLPAYHEWPVDLDSYSYRKIQLPQVWHFQYLHEFLSGEQYFAMFQITDLQQKTYCSEPVPIPNPNLIRAEMENETLKSDDLNVSCSIFRDTSPIESGMMIYITVENLTDTESSYRIDEVLINGTRKVGKYCSFWNISPGESASERMDISEESLSLLPDINSITLYLKKGLSSSTDETFQFEFNFRNSLPGDMTYSKSIGSAVHHDVKWELLKVAEASSGDLDILLNLTNLSDGVAEMESWATGIGSLQLDSTFSYGGIKALNPGENCIIHLMIRNRAMIDPFDALQSGKLTIRGNNHLFPVYILQENLLQLFGMQNINQISFFQIPNQYFSAFNEDIPEEDQFYLTLNEPFQLKIIESVELFSNESLLLMQDDFEIYWGNLFLADNGYALSLYVKNKTEKSILVEVKDLTVNDLPSTEVREFVIGANMIKTLCMTSIPTGIKDGTQADNISFSIEYNHELSIPVRVKIKDSVSFGEYDGLFINSDGVEFSKGNQVSDQEL